MLSTARLARVTLGWNLVVIIIGAWVRATGSGAGCANSWPTCDGVLLPELKGATAIEFTHRITSGVALLLVAWLVIRVFRTTDRRTPLRKVAALTGLAIVSESLIGAFIVVTDLVAENTSAARAISVPVHLVNTFVLLAGLVLTVFWIDNNRRTNWNVPERRALVWFGVGMLLIAGTGAVAALADTLFPAESLIEGLTEDFSATAENLTRLRIIHPIAAIVIGISMARWTLARDIEPGHAGYLASRIVIGVVFTQLVVGVINVWTLTPITIQLLHLALADILWIAWMWMSATYLTTDAEVTVSA